MTWKMYNSKSMKLKMGICIENPNTPVVNKYCTEGVHVANRAALLADPFKMCTPSEKLPRGCMGFQWSSPMTCGLSPEYVKNMEQTLKAAIFLCGSYTHTQIAALLFIPCS